MPRRAGLGGGPPDGHGAPGAGPIVVRWSWWKQLLLALGSIALFLLGWFMLDVPADGWTACRGR